MPERILINYDHDIVNTETDQNVIGATTDTTGMRTVPTPGGDIAYVRKFGTDYLITDVTDIEDPVDANMEFRVYAADGTLLGSRVGGGAYVDGAELATAQACYMEIEADGGAVTVLGTILVDTDVDAGGLDFVCAAETIADGDTLTLYLSDTGSTYYDENYMYGGGRHIPDPALNNAREPFFDIAAAIAACASANDDGVEVLDSATYDEQFTISLSQFSLYCTAGQTPTITSGIGARASREMVNQGDNTDTAYVSKAGNDADPGTYQEPYLTIGAAFAGLAGRTNIHVMDSDIYTENLTFNAAVILEPLYGHLPSVSQWITVSASGSSIYGMTIIGPEDPGISGIYITTVGNHTGTYNDNTVSNSSVGIRKTGGGVGTSWTGEISKNICYSNIGQGISLTDAPTTGTINGNICYSNSQDGIRFVMSSNTTAINITNNICYSNGESGLEIQIVGFDYTGNVENNTFYNNVDGINATNNFGAISGAFRDIITWSNSNFDLLKAGAQALTITESNYGTNSGFTVDGTDITTDPEFCSETLPYEFGISSNSGAYRTDTSSDDMGAHLRIIEINESTIEINGFFIDGQEQYNNAIYIVDTANHTALTLRWCDVFDFQGIAIDLYDDNTDTDAIINNVKVYQNGNGIKLSYGGNTIDECLIYVNTIFGIWADYAGQIFTHNVFFGNAYGLYLESNSAGITFRDTISNQNSLYGVYSESLTVIVTYCDITDGTNNVDATDSSNFTDNPLFVNTLPGSEDFHIKTAGAGFLYNSPCEDSSSTGIDVGAWNIITVTADDSWKKYELEFNPQVRWANIPKGVTRFNSAKGFLNMWAKAHRRGFVFDFSAPQVSSEELRLKMEYFSTMIRKRESNTVEEETKFRIHFQPTSLLESGTETIDSTAGTITDASKSWVENQWKGYHCGIQWTAGVGTGTVAAVARTLTVVPDPGWTNDEWIGYYYYRNGYYYYILDNDTDTLTLSDPLGTLVNENNADWNIEKYFKITQNNENVLCLCDTDGELPDGDYYYYIDFIQCVINRTDFGYTQPRFLYTREHSKTNYQVSFEETNDGDCD